MHYIVDAFIAGFGFGVIAFVVMHLYTSAKLRKMHKMRDEMRNTIYPSSAGWWELHQKLEAMNGKEQKHANANPRSTAQRGDTDAGT